MTQKSLPFASGFVLSNRDFGSIVHFEKRALPNGLWWWSDSFVDEDQASAENGDFLIIRGHWASGSEDGKDDPSAHRLLRLAQESIELFEDELDYLCGRYLIVLHLHGKPGSTMTQLETGRCITRLTSQLRLPTCTF